jgi:hypothetical protein
MKTGDFDILLILADILDATAMVLPVSILLFLSFGGEDLRDATMLGSRGKL